MFPGTDTGDSLRPALTLAGLTFTLHTTRGYAGSNRRLVIELSCDKPGCQNPGVWYSEEIKDFADIGAVLVGEHGADPHSCSDDPFVDGGRGD